jgi:hypothetical protein
VFENRVLRRIFCPKMEKVVRGFRGLHNEELHNLYTSPNIIRVIKSRRMTWMGHVARMGEMRNAYKISVGKNLKVRGYSKKLSIDGEIILKWILGK